MDLKHRAVQVLWAGDRVVNLRLWFKHQHLLGGLELASVRDMGIYTTKNAKGQVHVLSATN